MDMIQQWGNRFKQNYWSFVQDYNLDQETQQKSKEKQWNSGRNKEPNLLLKGKENAIVLGLWVEDGLLKRRMWGIVDDIFSEWYWVVEGLDNRITVTEISS